MGGDDGVEDAEAELGADGQAVFELEIRGVSVS